MLKDFIDDKLNRERYANFIINITNSQQEYKVLSDNKSLILAIDSPWGTGKTTFVNMLETKIKREYDNNYNPISYTVVSYNAWKCDFSDNPLETLIFEIYKNVSDSKNIPDDLKEDFFNALKLLGKVSLTRLLGDKDAVEDILEVLRIGKSTFKKKKSSTMIDYFKKYAEEKSKLDKFKESLGRICFDKKMIIIIDELDRCRPDFSIELLEAVKHIFDIPNLTFIFSLDIDKLSKGIEKIYGDINGTEYLIRFFDYISKMPKPDVRCICKPFIKVR